MRIPPPFDSLDSADIGRILDAARAGGASFAEIFFERRFVRRLRREEGRLRGLTASLDAGAGIRVLAGGGTGYACTSEPSLESLLRAAASAGRIAAAGGGAAPGLRGILAPGAAGIRPIPAPAREPDPSGVRPRAAYLEEIESLARQGHASVAEVAVSIAEESRSLAVANTLGLGASDEQVQTSVSLTVWLRSSSGRVKGHCGGGGRLPFETLATERFHPRAVAGEALRRARILLEAVEAPAGELPVVIGNGWGGVLLHEAIGHGFEADFVRRGTSIFTGRLGEKVASELCTVVDDGSIPGLRGSFGMDDEGTPPARTVLVEKGILRGYLHDLISAEALGAAPTGNGRRESYASAPIPRQSNLFMLAGGSDPEEILRSVARGLYARNLGGGQVDIVNGNFVFEVTEGYLIEEGRVGAPVRGANLIGKGPEVLNRIAAVGADFAFDPGIGTCGKDGQSQPVGVGQPTVLVSNLTIGGTRL